MTPRTEYRLYEMLLGAIVWMVLIASILLSFVQPLWAAVFIIVFDLYWLFRVSYFVINLILAWWNFKRVSKVDWRDKLETIPGWDTKVNIVVLPTYKEDKSVVEHTLTQISDCSYPAHKMVIVLAGEEKDKENFNAIADAMKEKFKGRFRDIIVTLHPANLKGELAGKGSNLHFVGPKLKAYADERNIPYKDVIVSAFDIDTIPHRHYFSYLTYTYCTHPNPTRSSYQPIPLYNNNMWDAPSVVRTMAFGTTFWMLSEVTRPFRMWTFSSHSMPLKALIDCGYWQKNLVSEDSRIFLQMFLRYDGAYEVTPLYLPVSMDTVTGASKWESIKNIYKQQRRWAWGAENLPFMLFHFKRNNRIEFRKKFRLIFNYLEGMASWALAPILILVLGRLPLWVGSDSFRDSIIFQNTPLVLEQLMFWSMIGLLVSAGLSFTLLPKPTQNVTWKSYVSLAFHWLLLPITLIVLGSFPAIDAQTRMMTGKYLGFNVTKKRKLEISKA